jgi:DNA-binding GntR family transcriptional regulator
LVREKEVQMTSQTPERAAHAGDDGAGNRFRRAASEEQIVERIFTAVLERRLRPGAKLTENALCDVFNVARSRIRRVLIMLAERGIVVLQPNRGAFIASPTPDEARHVFQARRTIEQSIVQGVTERITKNEIDALGAHVSREAEAAASGDRREAIRLSGEFHIRLAEVAGNPVMSRFLVELVARSSLIIALFGSRQLFSCSEAEHRELLGALLKGDAMRAMQLMDDHLGHLERELDIRDAPAETVDIRLILER